MVASKFSKNHFVYEKHKTVQPFKLHLFQNNPLLQLYSSAEIIGSIPGSHFMKAFSAIP
jgi:hypothetical protein